MRAVSVTGLLLALAFTGSMPVCADEPGGLTPEMAFSKFKCFLLEGNYRTACQQLTQESQQEMVVGMLNVGCLHAFSGSEIAGPILEALKKHGVLIEKFMQGDHAYNQKMLESIVDKPGCVADVVAALKLHEPSPNTTDAAVSASDWGTLHSVIVDGSTARGIKISQEGGVEKKTPVLFEKINNRWFLDMRDRSKPATPPPSIDLDR